MWLAGIEIEKPFREGDAGEDMVVAEIEAMDQAGLAGFLQKLQHDVRGRLGDVFQGDERAVVLGQQRAKKSGGALQPLRELLAVIDGIVVEMHDHQHAPQLGGDAHGPFHLFQAEPAHVLVGGPGPDVHEGRVHGMAAEIA